MTTDEAKKEVVKYWMEKADEALASAGSELSAARLSFAMNRAYYACYYTASALLLGQGLRFSKHLSSEASY